MTWQAVEVPAGRGPCGWATMAATSGRASRSRPRRGPRAWLAYFWSGAGRTQGEGDGNDRRGDRGGVGVRLAGVDPHPAEPPGARITVATSRQDEAPRLDALHPSLAGRIDLTCEPFDADRIAERASVAFLGLPHTASLAVAPDLRRRGVRVIDLSADYRLTDAQVYADWYGHAHTDPEGLAQAVYGLPELYRAAIPPAGPDRQPRLLHLDEHPGPGPLDRRRPDRADRDHHRRQERRLGRGAVAQAGDALPRVQRELLGLQRRPAPAHARDRPGPHRRRPRPGRGRRGDLHPPPRPDGPRHLRHDLRHPQGPWPSSTTCSTSTAPTTPRAPSSASSSTCPPPRTRPSPTSATSPCGSSAGGSCPRDDGSALRPRQAPPESIYL